MAMETEERKAAALDLGVEGDRLSGRVCGKSSLIRWDHHGWGCIALISPNLTGTVQNLGGDSRMGKRYLPIIPHGLPFSSKETL